MLHRQSVYRWTSILYGFETGILKVCFTVSPPTGIPLNRYLYSLKPVFLRYVSSSTGVPLNRYFIRFLKPVFLWHVSLPTDYTFKMYITMWRSRNKTERTDDIRHILAVSGNSGRQKRRWYVYKSFFGVVTSSRSVAPLPCSHVFQLHFANQLAFTQPASSSFKLPRNTFILGQTLYHYLKTINKLM